MVQALRLSNSLDARFCRRALEEALAFDQAPGIVNTDQSLPRIRHGGSQFTGTDWITLLRAPGSGCAWPQPALPLGPATRGPQGALS